MKCHFHRVLNKKSNIYIIRYKSLQSCVCATPSFMLAQTSGTVGLTLFSCYLKAGKKLHKISINNTRY